MPHLIQTMGAHEAIIFDYYFIIGPNKAVFILNKLKRCPVKMPMMYLYSSAGLVSDAVDRKFKNLTSNKKKVRKKTCPCKTK